MKTPNLGRITATALFDGSGIYVGIFKFCEIKNKNNKQMGWKASCIFINQVLSDKNILLNQIPYNLNKVEESEALETAIMPDDNDFYLGEYKGNTIICDYGLPFEFYSDDISDIESKLIQHFPNSTIIAITLMSTVNHYGFAIIENGEKTRVKVGDYENPVALEIGQITKEEIELQKNSEIDGGGNRMFKYEDDDEMYPEDTVGEEYVFEVSKRIFGFELNGSESDELLFETKLEKYKKE